MGKVKCYNVFLIDYNNHIVLLVWQACDAHSNEYITRLRDEVKTCEIISKLQDYHQRKYPGDDEKGRADKCRIFLRKIEHLYYKYDENAAAQVKASNQLVLYMLVHGI